VKKRKEEMKKKGAEKARRKEKRDKCQKLQRQAEEEEESSSIDDDDDDEEEEEVHQYDWLDSMAEGEQPGGSSLSIDGRSPQAEPPCHGSKGPDLEGATATGGGEEPSRPQELAHPEGMEES
jgi:hypothetical protein